MRQCWGLSAWALMMPLLKYVIDRLTGAGHGSSRSGGKENGSYGTGRWEGCPRSVGANEKSPCGRSQYRTGIVHHQVTDIGRPESQNDVCFRRNADLVIWFHCRCQSKMETSSYIRLRFLACLAALSR